MAEKGKCRNQKNTGTLAGAITGEILTRYKLDCGFWMDQFGLRIVQVGIKCRK
ncbi:MAG: hypothetical protein JSU65_01305 [Candidatus Zixiibacteriota bacterium]|nr:MAG: hypothetical protein JSU65_01305 [candidate division Zixibacteria bacterium]